MGRWSEDYAIPIDPHRVVDAIGKVAGHSVRDMYLKALDGKVVGVSLFENCLGSQVCEVLGHEANRRDARHINRARKDDFMSSLCVSLYFLHQQIALCVDQALDHVFQFLSP